MSVHSTARKGAVSVRDKFGRDLVASVPFEPSYRQIVDVKRALEARAQLESLPAGLRMLAEEAEILTEVKFGYYADGR